MEEKYYTREELVERFNVNSRTIKRWDESGKFPHAIGDGKTRRYPQSDIDAMGNKTEIKTITPESDELKAVNQQALISEAEAKIAKSKLDKATFEGLITDAIKLRDGLKELLDKETRIITRGNELNSQEAVLNVAKIDLEQKQQALVETAKMIESEKQKVANADAYTEKVKAQGETYIAKIKSECEQMKADTNTEVESKRAELADLQSKLETAKSEFAELESKYHKLLRTVKYNAEYYESGELRLFAVDVKKSFNRLFPQKAVEIQHSKHIKDNDGNFNHDSVSNGIGAMIVLVLIVVGISYVVGLFNHSTTSVITSNTTKTTIIPKDGSRPPMITTNPK